MPAHNIDQAMQELYFWQKQTPRPDNFHSILYTLFGKADFENWKALSQGFEFESMALRIWANAKDPDLLFKEYGLE